MTSLSLRLTAALLLIALPWLNPFAGGPSTWVIPWLFSAACTALLFGAGQIAAPRPALTIALAGLAAWCLARSGVSPEALAASASCLLVWMAAAVTSRRDEGLLRAVALAWLVAAGLSTAAALLQYFGVADRVSPWVDVSAVGEAFANLRQRNQFASLTAIGMAALLWLGPGAASRWPAIAAMMWLAVGNAATTSRTGLLQLLLLGAAGWMWPGARRPRMQLWASALAAYLVAAIALPWLLQVLTGEAATHIWSRVTGNDGCGSRLVLWSNVVHLIAQHPWLGWGWGELDYAHYSTLYSGARFCDILDNAHNLPLHLAVELGLPAAVVICAAFGWAILRAHPWREADPGRQMAWAVLLVVAVHSMLEYPLWYGPFQMALGLCLGFLWPTSIPDATSSPPRNTAATVIAAAILAAVGHAGWQYHAASQIYLPPERRASGWRQDPLAHTGEAWLFRSQVVFAELTLAPLTRGNAQWTFDTANALLHYSPEPRVIEKALDSALLLQREGDLLLPMARFRAAFPDAYSAWIQSRRGTGPAVPALPSK
jgi:O-antigen ligase